MEDNQDGTYRFSYMTSMAGAYSISVMLNGAERDIPTLLCLRVVNGCGDEVESKFENRGEGRVASVSSEDRIGPVQVWWSATARSPSMYPYYPIPYTHTPHAINSMNTSAVTSYPCTGLGLWAAVLHCACWHLLCKCGCVDLLLSSNPSSV